eukprot:15456569-Alexandrium_andersonii.AAC.1
MAAVSPPASDSKAEAPDSKLSASLSVAAAAAPEEALAAAPPDPAAPFARLSTAAATRKRLAPSRCRK